MTANTETPLPTQRPVVEPAAPPSAALDIWIRVREGLLDRLSGAGPAVVLNPGTGAQSSSPGDDLAAELRVALNRHKVTAMDEAGTAVDYAALRRSPDYAALHDRELPQLRSFQPLTLPSKAAQRAFWINLYNVLVLDAVIANSVQESVTEGRLGLLAFFRRAAYVVDGRRFSLDDIEHGILRANRGSPYLPGPHFAATDPRRAYVLPLDSRLHFALNCGGVSCPPIRAYTAEGLDAQLDLAARGFVDGTTAVDPATGELRLSQLFSWYGGDFGGHTGVLDFVTGYLPDDARRAALLVGPPRSIRYDPYDWSLNSL